MSYEQNYENESAEELYVLLTQNGFGGIIASFLKRFIKKKINCNMDLNFDEICIDEEDGKISLHVDINAELSKDELIKLLQSMNK